MMASATATRSAAIGAASNTEVTNTVMPTTASAQTSKIAARQRNHQEITQYGGLQYHDYHDETFEKPKKEKRQTGHGTSCYDSDFNRIFNTWKTNERKLRIIKNIENSREYRRQNEIGVRLRKGLGLVRIALSKYRI